MIGKLLYKIKLEYLKSFMSEEAYKKMKSMDFVDMYDYFYPYCYTTRRKYRSDVMFSVKAILHERNATFEDIYDAVESANLMGILTED